MPETQVFHGNWIVQVISKDAAFDERFVVLGSIGSDGAYPGVPGTAVRVDGTAWQLAFEWNNNVGSGWQPSDSKKLRAEYFDDRGLVVTIGVDDNEPVARDQDFNDIVVLCKNIDQEINPWVPFVNKANFTINIKG